MLEIKRTTAEHETAAATEVWEMEASQALMASMLADAGLTRGTVLERVEELIGRLERLGTLLSAAGCSCECVHHYQEHLEDCDRCLGCRVAQTMWADQV